MSLARCCGWWTPRAGYAIFQDRHCELHLDDAGALHNETGAAALYRDGFGVWAWHGVRVPQWIIEQPGRIGRDEILSEENAEIRRVMIERIGWERYIDLFQADEVATDDFGTLLRCEIDGNDQWLVKVVNSSPEPDNTYRDYILMVDDPQIHYGTRTPQAALASMVRYDDTDELVFEKASFYRPIIET